MREQKPRGIQSFVKVNTESLWLNQDTSPGCLHLGYAAFRPCQLKQKQTFGMESGPELNLSVLRK